MRHKSLRGKGQSIVEFALVLPLLLLFLLGMTEVGFAMFSYIRLASANREAARMASRGRFVDEAIAARVVSAGGNRQIGGSLQPNLRTTGTDTNTGIIVTHVSFVQDTGEVILPTPYISGTMTTDTGAGPVVRLVSADDGRLRRMSSAELGEYLDYRDEVADAIYAYRDALDYEIMSVESFVVIETYYAHDLLTKGLPFIDDPLTLYFVSTLRVLQDSRLD